MLGRLYIKNFALIEELEISFCEHFNVMTGETGAGKSIVIDAVSVLLGGRAQAEYIRSGTDRAILEGVFYLPPHHQVFDLLKEAGIENDDQVIVLSREITLSGRNACRVNGRALTLGQYRSIGLLIVEIHGQHDHQALLQTDNHINILDQFGGLEQLGLVREVKEKYNAWSSAKKELEELRTKEKERLQRMDFLAYQLKEIKEAKLKPGEMEELAREAKVLANAEKISSQLNVTYRCLFGGERGVSAYELVSKALASIEDIQRIDPDLGKLYAQLEPSLYEIEEAAGQLRKYLDNIDYSPRRLEQVERRLQVIKDIYKKYGPTFDEVAAFFERSQLELEKWEKSAGRAEELEEIVKEAWHTYLDKARRVSGRRKEIGKALEEKVTRELIELAMPHARFSVNIQPGEPSARGLDQVEFLISPNPGEPLLPVTKIASGGELSRIMLSLKILIADLDGIGTLIFDEIDAGIGGKAAQKVAEKLETISRSQQVICVTHSPLTAALADVHLLLAKNVKEGRTITQVKLLTKEDRVEELSRMMGGEKQTAELKLHASQILKKNN